MTRASLCLFSDSTNSEVPGFCPPERSVFPNLDRHIANAEGRVIVTTFASSIHRVSMILELALKNGRKVGLAGPLHAQRDRQGPGTGLHARTG